MKNSRIIALFIGAFLLSQLAIGQGFEVPVITHDYQQEAFKKASQSRLENDAPLTLPFWDDFSQSKDSPDSSRWFRNTSQLLLPDSIWVNSFDVTISPTVGINSMSLNVAVFDGINSMGAAHSSEPFQSGDTDILTSCAIDLSGKSASDSIYLSFFYEKKGNGEIPNDDDGIRVEFMNENSEWVTNIWSVKGEDIVEVDSFYQVLLPVEKAQFFSAKYRFRVIATGRETGFFDTWLVDYIYLNEGRSANDDEYPDRAFTKPINSPFKDYYSMPVTHFLADPSLTTIEMGSQYVQLGTNVSNVQQYELNVTVNYINEDASTGNLSNQQLATNGPNSDNTDDFNGLFNPYDRRDFDAETLIDLSEIPASANYIEIQAELSGSDWDDGMLGSVDLNINDTIRSTFILDNYYAYDDGSAERGAGVNQSESQIAYKFGAAMPDEISALDIYFPKTVREVQFGKQIRLKIWSMSNGMPGTELYTKDVLVQKNDTLNKFYRYEFEEKVAVMDTFFIGWEQITDERIYVGLDKNTDSRENIYFNINGDWESNNNDIVGSLMIRPVFDELVVDPNLVIAGFNKDEFESSVKLYPNPTSGILHIQGDYDQLDIITLNGRNIHSEIIKNGQNSVVNLYGVRPGMYIARLRKDNLIINKKIILNQ